MDDERMRRVGRNEAVFRAVNEQIESLNPGAEAVADEKMHIVCECGDLGCTSPLAVPFGDYERVRSDPELFFVVPGHERPDVERVVDETTDYYVVRKHRATRPVSRERRIRARADC